MGVITQLVVGFFVVCVFGSVAVAAFYTSFYGTKQSKK